MNPEQILPLLAFVFVMVGTPGPNNLMLLSAGANFGFRRSVPHILGISVGCQVLLFAIALGLGQLLAAYPSLAIALKVMGGLFLIYMAVQLARPKPAKLETVKELKPLTFWQAALFQWVNPKAWLMLIAVIVMLAVYFAVAGWLLARFYSRSILGTSLRIAGFVLLLPLTFIISGGGQFLATGWIIESQFGLSLPEIGTANV